MNRNRIVTFGIVLMALGVVIALTVGLMVFKNLRFELFSGGLSPSEYQEKAEMDAMKADLDAIKGDVFDIKSSTDPESKELGAVPLVNMDHFSMEGQAYQLPFPYKTLLDNSWTIETYYRALAPTTLSPGEETMFSLVKPLSNGKEIVLGVELYNNQRQSIATEDAVVLGVIIEAETNDPKLFTLPYGLELDDTEKEVVAKLGHPHLIYKDGEDWVQYSYYDEPQDQYILVFFPSQQEDPAIDQVYLKNTQEITKFIMDE